MARDPLDRLTSEEDFWQLRRAVGEIRSKEHRARWAVYVAVAVAVTLATGFTGGDVGDFVRSTSTALFSFAAAILGIVIAGFAVFTTIASTDVATTLALTDEPGTDVPAIKWMALHFVRVFIRYIEFLAVDAVIRFLGMKGGLGSVAAHAFTSAKFEGGRWAASVVLGLLAGYTALLVVELAIFAHNVNAAFMTMVRGRLDPYARRVAKRGQEAIDAAADAKLAEVRAKAIAAEKAAEAAHPIIAQPIVISPTVHDVADIPSWQRVDTATTHPLPVVQAGDAEPLDDDDDLEKLRRRSSER